MIGPVFHFSWLIAGQFQRPCVGLARPDNAYDTDQSPTGLSPQGLHTPQKPAGTRWRDSSIPTLGAKRDLPTAI